MTVRALPAPLDWPLLARAAHWLSVAMLALFWASLQADPFPSDARAYYDADVWSGLYYGEWNEGLGYFYSPTFGQLIYPLTLLSWPVFYAVWTGAFTIAFAWLVTPVLGVVLIVASDILRHGFAVANVDTLVLVAVVLARRWPGFWVATLLTKVTTSVGIAWHLARGEWGALRQIGLVLAVLVLPSLIFTGDLWIEWVRVLADGGPQHPGVPQIPMTVRIPIALALVVFAARRNWWVLATAATSLAIPNWRPETTLVWALAAFVHRSMPQPR